MTQELTQLRQLALSAQRHAYAPYSGFAVGAALVTDKNNTYSGCNVENAAYPLGQCAEASAIGNMILHGDTHIRTIVIVSPNEDFCYPCGGCRQKIAEFAGPDTQVVMVTQQGDIERTTIAALLPHSFSKQTMAG
ncbi:cytidine deaminase [Alteromonas halophila]|uniref:Cytidine deaminase n=1 Tax=Alteromonas halophila TaxID=516698 RepID=A0A918JML7_9ALTE|nr:cytidine deaminase [Alteromonas halophila]GGW87769.1 cytidine deaminase [Alteromonas halophila]